MGGPQNNSSDEPAMGYPADFSFTPTPPTNMVTWSSRDSRGCGSWTCNLLWLLLGGGLIMGLVWGLIACVLCCTLILIPCGLQLFKIAGFIFLPFGKRVERARPMCACPDFLGNLLWLPAGLALFLVQLGLGVALCLTIIFIPFGIQHIKLSLLCLWPFGTEVCHVEMVPQHESLQADAVLQGSVVTYDQYLAAIV
mmetsp:Transcript_39658/g.99698  ORF Transcript_39658/g.99698 Transcript_39658/m.99698 type:complete len:196 (-) Transcript_39658:257-844(-)